MPNQFTDKINSLRDESDKQSNTQAILLEFLKTPRSQQGDFVYALAEIMEELQERLHYLYLHYYNEEFL